MTGPYMFGKQQMWAARVSAVLGDHDAARGFLRGAFARGYPFGIDLHCDVDLALMADDSAFIEVLRPRE